MNRKYGLNPTKWLNKVQVGGPLWTWPVSLFIFASSEIIGECGNIEMFWYFEFHVWLHCFIHYN